MRKVPETRERGNGNQREIPFFVEMMTKEEKNVHMTEEEHRAFVRYIRLQDEMGYVERQGCYYIGQIHANILNRNSEKRLNSAVIDSVIHPGSCEEVMWNHEETPMCLENVFKQLQIDSEKRVKINPGYQKLTEEEQNLLEEHPFIQSMVYGDTPCAELRLSVEQQQAMLDFMDICCKKAPYTELANYEIGLKTCIEYFLGCLYKEK